MQVDCTEITNEQRFLLQILSDYISLNETRQISGIDWHGLYTLSKNHEVTGIIYYQCKRYIPEECSYKYERSYAASLYYSTIIKNAVTTIRNALKDNSINAFIVKGVEIANYYPQYYLRTMGDVDIIVEPGAKARAIRILCELGYEGNNDLTTDTWCGSLGEMHIEVHDTLVKKIEYANEYQIEFFNNYMEYYNDYCLDWSFHFLFLIMHLRKHIMAEGVGLRQFLDIAVVIRNNPDLNWAWIEDRAAELELQRFAHACYWLINRWFGIKVPVCYEGLLDGTVEEVTKTIMRNGVFGFSDSNNNDYRAKNALLFNHKPTGLKRISFILRKLFPRYRDMINYHGCSFLKGKPFLLPYFWGVRLVHIITDKNDNTRLLTLKSAFVSKNDIEKRKSLFEELGLM